MTTKTFKSLPIDGAFARRREPEPLRLPVNVADTEDIVEGKPTSGDDISRRGHGRCVFSANWVYG